MNLNFYNALPGESYDEHTKRKIKLMEKMQRMTTKISKLTEEANNTESIAERYEIAKKRKKIQKELDNYTYAINNEYLQRNSQKHSSQFHNFKYQIDEQKEFETILSILGEREGVGIDERIAYRLLMIHGKRPTAENIYKYSDLYCSFDFLVYHTDNIKALQNSPLSFLDDEQREMFDCEGYPIDEETGQREPNSKPLAVNLSLCFNIDGCIYQAYKID